MAATGLRLRASLALAALGLVALAPMDAPAPSLTECLNGYCAMRMTAPELLAASERAVTEKRWDDARAMLAALASAPEMGLQTRFLTGLVDEETGDLKGAAKSFRAVLRDRPDLTRARLELARTLMLQGKDQAAEHHFRLAEQDRDLPPEIARTIRSYRGLLHDRKPWHLNLDVGLAPDSNVNGATSAHTIDLSMIDPQTGKPAQAVLNDDARRRSGTGQYASVSAGVRLRLSDGKALLIDADGSVINQPGHKADDVSLLLAAGPELTMRNGARIAIQAVGVQRWYGGVSATSGGGARVSYQQNLGRGARIGAQVETRRISSGYGSFYGGWQHSAALTYERVIDRSMVATGSLFVRRDDLRSKSYSDTEFGGNLGIGGELPKGINAGLSIGLSRALFDAPLLFLSPDTRRDWRFNARAYVGLRSVRVLGFSPSLTYTYNRVDTTLGLYRADRHRFQFGLARYF